MSAPVENWSVSPVKSGHSTRSECDHLGGLGTDQEGRGGGGAERGSLPGWGFRGPRWRRRGPLGRPAEERKTQETSFAVFEPRVHALLVEFPDLPATVIAERVGWAGSRSWFRDEVAELRPLYRHPDPADRLTWAAGETAQCDLHLWRQRRDLARHCVGT